MLKHHFRINIFSDFLVSHHLQLYNNEEWYYSIVDIVGVLIQQKDNETARRYWNKTKQRILKEENNELGTTCLQLKLPSHKNGKLYKTDCSTREGVI